MGPANTPVVLVGIAPFRLTGIDGSPAADGTQARRHITSDEGSKAAREIHAWRYLECDIQSSSSVEAVLTEIVRVGRFATIKYSYCCSVQ